MGLCVRVWGVFDFVLCKDLVNARHKSILLQLTALRLPITPYYRFLLQNKAPLFKTTVVFSQRFVKISNINI